MGDVNQSIYLKKFAPAISGPVLEIGSKNYGNTTSFRHHFSKSEYVGVDMEAGDNVDVVADLTEGTASLKRNYFALGVCCSVLEHVKRPWIMAENITALIRSGGMLYVSVPWVWRYHPYPDDYFRFSWRGIMEIFPAFEWKHICYSTNVPNEIFEITQQTRNLDDQMAIHLKVAAGNRKHLPYLMVNMLGFKNG